MCYVAIPLFVIDVWCWWSLKMRKSLQNISLNTVKYVDKYWILYARLSVCPALTNRTDQCLGKDTKCNIQEHLISLANCLVKYSKVCFRILDTTKPKHQLRIKELLLKRSCKKQKHYDTFKFQLFFFPFCFLLLSNVTI